MLPRKSYSLKDKFSGTAEDVEKELNDHAAMRVKLAKKAAKKKKPSGVSRAAKAVNKIIGKTK